MADYLYGLNAIFVMNFAIRMAS